MVGELLASAGMAATQLGGAALEYHGAMKTNEANAQQAQMNRDFQERMSSTAMQRHVADLKAAGLNPAIAYGGSGASSPSGASATLTNPFQGSAQNAQAASMALLNMAQAKANILKTAEETRAIRIQGDATRSRAASEIALRDIDIMLRKAQHGMSQAELENIRDRLEAELENTRTRTRREASSARHLEYDEQRAKNEQGYEQGIYRERLRGHVNDARGALGLITDLRGMTRAPQHAPKTGRQQLHVRDTKTGETFNLKEHNERMLRRSK